MCMIENHRVNVSTILALLIHVHGQGRVLVIIVQPARGIITDAQLTK